MDKKIVGYRKLIVGMIFMIVGLGVLFMGLNMNELSQVYQYLIWLAGILIAGNSLEHIGGAFKK